MAFDWQDPFGLDSQLTEEERAAQSTARACAEATLAPRVQRDFTEETTDPGLFRIFGEHGLLGVTLAPELGGAGMSYISYGLIAREVERIDSGYRSMLSVQSSLVIHPIAAYGSAAQHQKYLPGLTEGTLIGCFGLTEPDAGSDPGAMRTVARAAQGGGYILNGSKTWITNAPIADVFIVWAKSEPHGGALRGFVLDRGLEGLATPRIGNKLSLRTSVTGMIMMDDVHVSEDALLPNIQGMGGPFGCLNRARFGIGWGTMGAAEACYHAAREYGLQRRQFNRPLAATQLYQRKLADMATDITFGLQAALRVGHILEQPGFAPETISMLKRTNCRNALAIARQARDMHGGNGISGDYPVMRHMLNLETVNTYEGTEDIHALILGRAITGLAAF